MQYSEVIEYLYEHLPVFQHQGPTALKKGLDGITKLCKYLNNPQNNFKSIHIAGTNGKGSTSHMLAAVFQQNGYNTGLYTSPHLVDFRERIRLNGSIINEEFIVQFITTNKAFIEQNSFSFFEVTVALAFKYFADNQVDIAVIEVGLGGRLDSTNIITPILSIITNISYDHKNILGSTLNEIAHEKAGIIKKNVPVVVSTTQPELDQIFKEKAGSEGAEIYFADQNFEITSSKHHADYFSINVKKRTSIENVLSEYYLRLDLMGTYQLKNILGVLQAIEILKLCGYKLEMEHNEIALGNVSKTTGLLGRWQRISKNPLIICDTGHNPAGIAEVVQNIELQKYNKLHMVIGFVKDKDVSEILKLFPQNANYYFCKADIIRALESTDLQQMALNSGLIGTTYPSVESAFKSALNVVKPNDFIFVGGSTFVVGDFLKNLDK